MKGNYAPANVREILPEIVAASIEEGIRCFDQKLQGFADPDALLSGVESRTSSPVRISRDPSTMEGSVKGLYPCGEGAGYAGGITSAAMDGIRMAEAVQVKSDRKTNNLHKKLMSFLYTLFLKYDKINRVCEKKRWSKMKGHAGKNTWALFLLLLAGIVLGGL